MKKRILNSDITHATHADVLQSIAHLAETRTSSYICLTNVHMMIESYRNHLFNRILNQATMALPDGKPVAILMNLLYQTRQARIAGPDLMVEIFRLATENQFSIFFYGSTEDVLSILRSKLFIDFPNLKIAGMISPPFRQLTPEEDALYLQTIVDSGAHIVLVGLGCPKQEHWMAERKEKIQAVMLGVGAAFPFYSGHIKRCPLWMQNYCLEWLYRLLSEPGRLFKRYLYTNTLFILLAIAALCMTKCSNVSNPLETRD